jgi:hypothetical protein
MNLSDIARAPKTDIHLGDWRAGHIPRTTFPLSLVRAKNYKLGPEYRWRGVTFDCLRNSFRLLIVFNAGKQIYRASLGMELGQDLVVLCQYEFHASEPGWHCHVTFQDTASLPAGIARSHLRRWPKPNAVHSRLEFGVRESNAVGLALTRFRISPIGPLGL